jgi:hypothetical protein
MPETGKRLSMYPFLVRSPDGQNEWKESGIIASLKRTIDISARMRVGVDN